MAIELCSENSGFSPRISFSHDFGQSDTVPVEQHPFRSNSLGSLDFDFCVRKSFDQESSIADELFFDGKILPMEIKKKIHGHSSKQTDPSIPSRHASRRDDDDDSGHENTKKESLKEIKNGNEETDEKQGSKSFWRFKRSSSLNCGSGYGRTLCPLPLLSRSYSTGSSPNAKRPPLSRDSHSHRQHSHKHASFASTKSSQSSSSTSYQKPPLRKNYGSYNGNGVRVTPVLNVPSGNLFGLGSIFFNGKDKNNKKK